jgi:hypothetical protein
MEQSQVHSYLGPRSVRPLQLSAADVKDFKSLAKIGINVRKEKEMAAFAMDTNDVGINPSPVFSMTSPGIPSPVQFLQAWLPGFVSVITAPRKIDELIGVTTVGAFEDEEIVQGLIEPLGDSVLYSDYGNVPLTSWNAEYERRTIIRNELGFKVGVLEEARSAKIRVSTANEKRAAATLKLEIQRNRLGFYGFNNGANRTFGFLNDPLLPAYVSVPAGSGGSTEWATKSFLEITADIRAMMASLRVSSKDVIDPMRDAITLALPVAAVDYMSVTSDYGISVRDWFAQTYPNARVVSAPELDDANGGVSAVYVYAETVSDGVSSDNGRVFDQFVPAKFMTLGVARDTKAYVENFANASAGVMLKRPFAVQRFTGV